MSNLNVIPEPTWQSNDGSICLYNADCFDILPKLARGSIALVFIDLPYGLNVAEWDKDLFGLEAIPIARELLLPGGSIYATCTPHIFEVMLNHIKWRRIITWCKPNLPLRKNLQEWEWSTEFVLWETKGDPRVFNKPWGEDGRDYWRIHVENGFLNPDGFKHPARKPIALLKRIIGASSNPGDVILDPFMGTGTAGVVCAMMGRKYIGVEISQEFFHMSAERNIAVQGQTIDDSVQASLFNMVE